ncbi:MAG: hypothetical protein QOJ60_1922 [Actinomycetota bacterium]|nr:hypothetical protein [Actinomycetota bacterium]
MPLQSELIEAEREGWQALTTTEGAAYYERNLTTAAIMGFPSGVMTRSEALDAMRSAPPWSSFEILEPRVVELTQDCGVLVYQVVAQRVGQRPYRALISSVYVRHDDRWLLAFHQQSPS